MLLLALTFTACQQAPPPPPPPPDVVLVVVDTLRADHLSTYGHSRSTSPALDALAAESMVYERALAHAGWTLPSMASILTGRYPSEHQATRDPHDVLRFNRLDEQLPTLASLLAQRGYRTAAWVNNTYMAPEFSLDKGFEVYDYEGSGAWGGRDGYATVAAALEWLASSDQPAFAFIHIMEPHYPYLPPEHLRRRFTGPGEPPVELMFFSPTELATNARWTKRFSEEQEAWIARLYDEEVLAADEAIGQLAAGLRTQGRWDRTVLAVTADHGEELWDHGAFEHGHALYGELIRVPLLLRAPGLASGREARLVQHADLFQTLLALGGVPAPAEAHGHDLRQLPVEERPVLSEDCLYGPPRIALTQGELRLIVNLDSKVANVFELDAGSQGDVRVEDQARAEQLALPMAGQIRQLRGDLLPRDLPERTAPLTTEAMEQLRSLGYLSDE
jgi:arylsulfatase A-like enzyme